MMAVNTGRCKWCGQDVTYDRMFNAWYDRADGVGCAHSPWLGFKYFRRHEVEGEE